MVTPERDSFIEVTASLEQLTGHVFHDPSLLLRALTTPACRMDNPSVEDNQRLEFLGDAVFGLLAAEALFRAYPKEQEGMLTVRRTHLVSGQALAAVAERLELRRFLRFNHGAAPLAVNAKPLADAMEAIMGAVWLDGGIAAARTFFDRLNLPMMTVFHEWAANPKGELQVRAQAMHPPRKPVYVTDRVKGPAHAPIVTVTVKVKDLGEGTATAVSLRQAEVAAAVKLLEKLDADKGTRE